MSKKLIEIYLFVDPLGKKCNNARKTINKFREDHVDDIKLRIIPIVNSKKVLGYSRKDKQPQLTSFVEKNNRFSTNTYHACLAFHASTMQGKKTGHQFLSDLQAAVVEEKEPFSEDLVYTIAEDIHSLDEEMFIEDYNSDLTKNIYHRNLKLAAEMNITKTPSCVIIKNNEESEEIRVDKEIEGELLHAVCGLNDVSVMDNRNKRKGNIIHNILNFSSQS